MCKMAEKSFGAFVHQAAKRRRTEHYKDWYVRENGRLVDENDRLKQTLNRLRQRGFWARVFNR